MKRRNGFASDGEFTYLCQRALYVEPAQRPIDLNTIPEDGNEYIHKARLENARLDFGRSHNEIETLSSSSESSGVARLSKLQLRKAAAEFAHFANELKIRREFLKSRFPQSEIIPVDDEIESCMFCLGSAKCMAIYDYTPSVFDAHGHLPFLRHAIHLNQLEVKKLLRCTFKWYKSIGMDEEIGRWLFALLACTDKPLSDSLEQFLVDYFDDLKMYLQRCEEQEYQRVRTLMSVMENYFVLKPKQHDGAYLNQLLRLNS